MLRNRFSLNAYLSFIIVSVVVVVITGNAALSFYSVKNQIMQDIQAHSESVLVSLQKSMVSYMEAYAVNEYEMRIQSEMDTEDIYAIIVHDRKMGEILGQDAYITGKTRDDAWNIIDYVPDAAGQTDMFERCFYAASADVISDSGENIGRISVCNSDRAVNLALERIVRENINYSLFISLLLIFILVFTIRRAVLRPITSMVNSLMMSDGMLREKVSPQGPKEIAILATSMNTMIDAVKSREEALRESESRFRLLVENMPAMVFLKDAEHLRFELFNRAGERLLGYDRSELMGKSDFDFFDEKQANFFISKDREVLESHKMVEIPEEEITTSSGEKRLLHTIKTGIYDEKGKATHLLGVSLDITEKKEMQAQALMLSQAMEQSGEAIVITDADGVIEHVNSAFSEITGYGEEESIGNKTSLLKSGSQNPDLYTQMWAAISAGKTWRGKVINRKKSGDLYPAMLTISPIMDENGHIKRYIGIQQNLEKLEALEAQFRQSQKMEAIGTLVGGIAHDFNNTLAGITGNIYLAKKEAESMPNVVDRLKLIERLAFGAAGTIQQLLTFSRKGRVNRAPVRISSFLKETIKLQRASVPENIHTQMEVTDSDLTVRCDVNQMQQVLMNLINNAVDALSGVENPSITVQLDRFDADSTFNEKHGVHHEAGYAHISVSDNGCGIEEEYIDHIFEPFFTTKAPDKGTGLGLAMVYGSIHSHNGVIEIHSSQKKNPGTTVHIYLPLDETRAVTEEQGGDEHADGHGSETILMVDDNELVLNTAHKVLESLGYQVIVASNGNNALEQYKEHQNDIDLVILDVVMPGLGGVDTLKAMREMNPSVKVMFATGYDKKSTLDGLDDIDSIKVISKPFAVGPLSKAIRKVLDK